MTITINKDNFPRFVKRLKKSLQKSGIDLPLNQVQEVAAQSLGKDSLYKLNALFNNSNANLIIPTESEELALNEQDIHIPSFKDYEWFIEDAGLQIGASMGRLGQSIGIDHIKTAVTKSLQHILSKNSKITLNEDHNPLKIYESDKEI